MKPTFFLAAFLILATALHGQSILAGRVLTGKTEPAVGANLYIKGTFDGTSTDADGQFHLPYLPGDSLTLVVSYIGFQQLEQLIPTGKDSLWLEFRLKPQASELQQVVISAGAFEASDEKKAVLLKPIDIVTTAGSNGNIVAALNTLPAYYQSYCHIMQAVGAMQQGKPDQITAFLEKAQGALDKAKEISSENPEILALQGYIYTGHIWADPMGNGPMYSPQSVAAYQTAIEAGPDHPRAYHLMGMHLFYMPAMYGGGPERAVSYLEKAAERFESYEPASPMHPAWGSYFNQQLLEQATAKLEKEEK